MKLLIIFILFITISFSLELKKADNFNQALTLALKEDKNILMFVYSKHCPWCTKMKDTTLKDDEAIEFINNRYIFIPIDKESDNYPEDLNPDIIPTTYLIDQNTKKVKYTLYGYKPTEYLINELWDE